MIKTIGFFEFCDSFSDTYKNNFTYNGKRALFDYLEQYGEDTGEPVELDTVSLCCEYSEFKDLEEVQADYPDIKSMEELQDSTTVIEFEGGLIIQQF
jgi:hypothetical protein